MEHGKDVTDYFVQLGREFIDECSFSNLVCAYAGGSVGRGEADAFSDLDLNLFVEGEAEPQSENHQFKGHLIQLHVRSAPTAEEVYENPWGWRYLKEARVLVDPRGSYVPWIGKLCAYIDSQAGKAKMKAQASANVDHYHTEAQVALAEGFSYSAYLAAWAGWMEALQMAAFFQGHSLSDSQLYQLVHQVGRWDVIKRFFQETYRSTQDLHDALTVLSDYRAHLRLEHGKNEFALASENDLLLKNKLQRLQGKNQLDLAGFLLYSEAIWIYHSVDSDNWLETHWEGLPPALRLSLMKLGYFQADEPLLTRMRNASEELIMENE